jgi:hypothetical protein
VPTAAATAKSCSSKLPSSKSCRGCSVGSK